MLDRLARRVEVRTAEIRGEAPVPPADNLPRADPPVDGPPAEDPAPERDPDSMLVPPVADHTPAWGRLAELSARFDGTVEPIVGATTADGDPSETPEEFAGPETSDNQPEITATDHAESGIDEPITASESSGETDDPAVDGTDLDDAGIPDADTVAGGDVLEVDAVVEVEAVVETSAAEETMIEMFSPHSELGSLDDETHISGRSDEAPSDPPVGTDPPGSNDEHDVALIDGPVDNTDDDGLPIMPDNVVAAVGEPVMFEAAIAPSSTGETGDAAGDGTGSNTEIVLSAAAERLAAPTDDRFESSLAGLEALDRILDGGDPDQAAGHTQDQPAVVDPHDLAEVPGDVPVVTALADEDWAGWNPDPTPGQPSRPSAAASDPDEHDADDDLDEAGVHHGPRWYRRQIRQFGVVAGLIPMVLLGGAAALALASRGGALGGQIGLLLGTAAAPGLLVAGAPFANSNTYPYAAVGSIPFWLLLGWVARRRTLRRPVADWRDYAGQLAWLTVAVILGAAAAIAIAAVRIGGPLLG